jgi:hypothetical protein
MDSSRSRIYPRYFTGFEENEFAGTDQEPPADPNARSAVRVSDPPAGFVEK